MHERLNGGEVFPEMAENKRQIRTTDKKKGQKLVPGVRAGIKFEKLTHIINRR